MDNGGGYQAGTMISSRIDSQHLSPLGSLSLDHRSAPRASWIHAVHHVLVFLSAFSITMRGRFLSPAYLRQVSERCLSLTR